MKAKHLLFLALIALIGGGVFYLSKNAPGRGGVEMLEANGDKIVEEEPVTLKGTVSVPQRVLDVLAYVKKNDKSPEGYVGGRTFDNRENRLPRNTTYREWDVRPKVKGKNRGAERLITSKDKHAYYTNDHYRSFTKIE